MAHSNFVTLKTRILRDVFIVNLSNRDVQNRLCRSTKTPEEEYRIALSYESGDKFAKKNECIDNRWSNSEQHNRWSILDQNGTGGTNPRRI